MSEGNFEQRLRTRANELESARQDEGRKAEAEREQRLRNDELNKQEADRVRSTAKELAVLLTSRGIMPDTDLIERYDTKIKYERGRSKYLRLPVEIPKKVFIPVTSKFWVADLDFDYTPGYTDPDPSRFRSNSTTESFVPVATVLDREGELLRARSGTSYDNYNRPDLDKYRNWPDRISSLELSVGERLSDDELLDVQTDPTGLKVFCQLPKSSDRIMGQLEALGLRYLGYELSQE